MLKSFSKTCDSCGEEHVFGQEALRKMCDSLGEGNQNAFLVTCHCGVPFSLPGEMIRSSFTRGKWITDAQ